jgi:hypothetical protein
VGAESSPLRPGSRGKYIKRQLAVTLDINQQRGVVME